MNDDFFDSINMGMLKSSIDSSLEKRKTQQKDFDEYLKKQFASNIKGSFLLKVLNEIRKRTDDFQKLLNCYFSDLPWQEILVNGDDDPDINAANLICGVHNFNNMFDDDYTRANKQKSPKYINELVDQVIEMIKVRKYSTILLPKKYIIDNHTYIYYPPIYYVLTANTYLAHLINEYKTSHQNIVSLNDHTLDYLEIIFKILDKIDGVCKLIYMDSTNLGFSIARGAVELYAIFLALKYGEGSIDEYYKFNEYRVKYYNDYSFDSEFEKKYSKKDKSVNKKEYLTYGWLDSIVEFGYVNNYKSYKFFDLCDLVDTLLANKFNLKKYGSNLKNIYSKCHYFTHANMLDVKDNIYCVLDLATICGIIINGLYKEVAKLIKIPLLNGVDVVKNLNTSLQKMNGITKKKIKYTNKYMY